MHIITRMISGGAQQVVLDLLRGQKQEGADLVLVSGEQTGPEGSLWNEVKELGVELILLPHLVREVSPVKDLKALHRIRVLIRHYKPQIVHSHTSKAGFIGSLAARKEKVPAIFLAPHGHILGKEASIPGVPEKGIKKRILAFIAKRSSKYADIVISPNESEREDGIQHGLWDENNSVVVPNGVDTERFCMRDKSESRKQLGLDDNKLIVGIAARLTKEKGVDFAIQTIKEIPEGLLLIAGDGPELDKLKKLATALGISDRVKFLGLKNNMEEIFPAFDICLAPSRTEAHGMSAAEASSCGIPVVTSDVGGLRSVVLNEKTGFLITPGNIEGYAGAIRKLVREPEVARSFTEDGRAHIVDSFSCKKMNQEMSELYQRFFEKGKTDSLSKEDLQNIVSLHISGSVNNKSKKPFHRYNFYLDKIKLFYNFNPGSILVKRNSAGEITGVLIYTDNEKTFNNFAGPKHLNFYARTIKTLCGYYGFDFIKYFKVARSSLGKGVSLHDDSQESGSFGKIWVLLVAEEYRKKGIASDLINQCMLKMKKSESRCLRVTVKDDNTPAIRVYSKAGFSRIGTCEESIGQSFVMQLKV